jgi:hypothetical protein
MEPTRNNRGVARTGRSKARTASSSLMRATDANVSVLAAEDRRKC